MGDYVDDNQAQTVKSKPAKVQTFSPRFEDQNRHFALSSNQNMRVAQLRSPIRTVGNKKRSGGGSSYFVQSIIKSG